ncbi:MAG: aspartyl protease family protein [Phycisphaeraceae bacterium]|nr:aspartyl protease family protein [Phycisphaeraceae bacterium]
MKNSLPVRSALLLCCGLALAPCSARLLDEPPAPHSGKTDADGVPLQGEITFDRNASPALEVKRIKSGHILVRPKINNHDAGWFIFDTGAGICCISTPQVAGLDLQENGSIQASGVGGSKQAKLYNAREMQLGAMTFKDHPLMEVDLAFLEPLVGEKICGIIGYGVISKSVAEIDLAAPSISLFDPETYTLSQGEWTPLDIHDRVPTVPGAFEGHAGTFRLDLGATGSVTFHQPAVEKYELLKDREVKDCKLGGVGGFVAGKRGKITSLELGGSKFENVDADFALEAKGALAEPSKDANIGTDILRKFVIITDYPHLRIGLVPKPEGVKVSTETTATK